MSNSRSMDTCSSCGTGLSNPASATEVDRTPCPSCGSLARTINLQVSDSATLREKVGLKHKRPGHSKPVYESVSGDDLHRASGKWNHLEREIDREHNRYRERIVAGDTGEIIRNVDEPLSNHVGRGAAQRSAADSPPDA